jgi:L-methionine (R)-S-oxide reductase
MRLSHPCLDRREQNHVLDASHGCLYDRKDIVHMYVCIYVYMYTWHSKEFDMEADPAESLPCVDYSRLASCIDAKTRGERDFLANAANAAAAIWHAFHDAGRVINWCGFYFNRPLAQSKERVLVLGPFQGKPACKRIPFHRGVCGTAASTGHVQRIPNVHAFPGHIACDDASESELVLPLMIKRMRTKPKEEEEDHENEEEEDSDVVVGVFDLDCPHRDGFQTRDMTGLINVLDLVIQRCDWAQVWHLSVPALPSALERSTDIPT